MIFASKRLRSATVGLGAVICSFEAGAYEMSPLDAIHEAMTELAEACLIASGGAAPTECATSGLRTAMGTKGGNRSETQKGTRWPDDPTGMISISAAAAFVLQMKGACESNISSIGTDQTKRNQLGLLCQSHYGDLQFFHAMASQEIEQRETTVAKMEDWSRLAFRVATDATIADTNYCTYFEATTSDLPAIAPSLLGTVDSSWCKDRPGRYWGIFPITIDAWKVQTLFRLTCKNAFSQATCKEKLSSTGRKIAVNNSKGALLHMVQDSYSMSHAHRTISSNNEKDFSPAVRCAPILSFYSYTKQKRENDKHDAADQFPIFDCETNSNIHDVITASANILYFIEQGTEATDKKQWEDKLVIYLKEHVIGESPVSN